MQHMMHTCWSLITKLVREGLRERMDSKLLMNNLREGKEEFEIIDKLNSNHYRKTKLGVGQKKTKKNY